MQALQTRSVASRVAVRPARAQTVVVRAAAQDSRRSVLGLLAAGVAAAALAVPQQANAIVNPAQESYGGLGRSTGSAGSSPKSPTRASMEGYTLEGTRKSGISGKQKKKLLSKLREEAVAAAKK